MVYTSYFAKLKKLPENAVPVSICAKAPAWYDGLQYKKLAPKYGFFMEWKKNHDNGYYNKCFDEQVLKPLDASKVLQELKQMVGDGKDIVLICYEKPSDFCHRHRVAAWLTHELGMEVNELEYN